MVRATLILFCSAALLASASCAPAASQQVTLLDFFLPTCGPCRQMSPVISRLESEGVQVKRIDGSQHPQLAQRFRVDRYPTFVVLAGQQEVKRVMGIVPYQSLKQDLLAAAQLPAAPPKPAQPKLPLTFASTSNGVPPIDVPRVPGQPAARNAAPAAQATPAQSPAGDELICASVRLRVQDATGQSFGTGTIVDARQGEALVLTCAHLFRDGAGKAMDDPSSVTAELYQSSEQRLWVAERVPVFRILSCNFESDVAFVIIRPQGKVRAARIAAANTLRQGDPVVSVGCDHGADPSVRTSQITAINRYQGAANVTSSGAPVVGRSGGGLFDLQQQVVGVCNAADYEDDEGIYAALPAIHAELDKLNLSAIYRGGELSAAAAPEPRPEPMTPLVRAQDQGPLQTLAALNPSERAALEEIVKRAADSEVVCVIRPKTPDGRSQVLTLEHVSPEFVKALLAAYHQQASPASPAGFDAP